MLSSGTYAERFGDAWVECSRTRTPQKGRRHKDICCSVSNILVRRRSVWPSDELSPRCHLDWDFRVDSEFGEEGESQMSEHGILSTSDGMDLHYLHSESYIFGGSPRASALSNFRPFCSYQTIQQGRYSTWREVMKLHRTHVSNNGCSFLLRFFFCDETKMRVLVDWVDTYWERYLSPCTLHTRLYQVSRWCGVVIFQKSSQFSFIDKNDFILLQYTVCMILQVYQ